MAAVVDWDMADRSDFWELGADMKNPFDAWAGFLMELSKESHGCYINFSSVTIV